MKKYLIMGAAAVAFASCSHDMDFYNPDLADQLVVEKYNQAFVDNFGVPAANQTWGFGDVAGARTTRAIQPSFNFPSDADASKFLSDVPAGVAKLTQNNASVNNWIDESWTGEINIWGNWNGSANVGGTLYIKGGVCDYTNRKFYFAGNSELYLLAGTTLKLNSENAGNLQGGTKIYIAEGATLIADGELKANKGLYLYNHGTVEATNLSVNENSVVYNVGTITVKEKISVENGESVIVNDGEITANELNTAGSGKFENNNEVNIEGITSVNSNSNTWVNNGLYHTGYFIYNAASDDVINNCRMIVDEDFNMNLGDNAGNGNFKMDAGSSVVTKNFNGGRYKAWYPAWNNYREFGGGPFFVYMGSNSVFKVTETATMDATKDNYGIYGPETGDYAVFQAAKIVAGQSGQGYEVTYGGNLAVVTDSHFAQGYSGNYPYINIKGNAKIYAPGFEAGEPEIYIAETECNPGFGSSTTTTPDPEPETPTVTPDPDPEFEFLARVFAEDLSATSGSDFDFNDVVFDVYTDGTNAEIEVLAAGGTLPLTVAGEEVHALFGEATDVMINTNADRYTTAKGVNGKTASKKITVPGVASMSDLSNIEIRVQKTNGEGTLGWYLLTADQGQPAAKFAVAKQIKWCNERQDIKKIYTGFVNWVTSDPAAAWYEVIANDAEGKLYPSYEE